MSQRHWGCIQGSSISSTCLENGSSRSSPISPLFSTSSWTLLPNGSPRLQWTVRLISAVLSPYFIYTHDNEAGQVVVHSLTTPETYSFDLKRPMKTIALEPNFAKKSTRAFVYGGLAGSLILREKGWLGHKETVIHSGEGPIWQVRWKGRLIAWANDLVCYSNDLRRGVALADALFIGCQTLRPYSSNSNILHRPTIIQSSSRSFQMHTPMAR